MCRASTDPRGPKRCNNTAHLKALPIEALKPATRPGVPDLAWSDRDTDLDALWLEYADRKEIVAAGLAVLQAHADVEPHVTAALQQAVEGTGNKLAGLEFRLKSPASLVRKISARLTEADRTQVEPSAETEAGRLSDVLRFTVETPDQDSITGALRSTVERLHAAGLKVTEIDNKYASGNSYKAVHLSVRTNEGVLAEVQLHSSAGLLIKEESHMHYELARDVNRSLMERQASSVKSKSLYENLQTPRGLNSIEEVDGVTVRKS